MKFKIVFMVSLISLLIIAPTTFAATPNAEFNGLLELIEKSSAGWFDILLKPAETLFFSLAVIAIVMKIGPFIFEGADFGKLLGELIWLVLTICFFYALMIYSKEWGTAIVDSFRDAGGMAIGASKALNPGDVFMMGVDLASTVGSAKTWNPLEGMMIGVSALLVLLSFVFMAAFVAVAIIESIIVINAAVLLLGFGAISYTREYAMAMPRYAVSVGAKLFIITLIVGLISKSGADWKAAYDFSQTSMWTLVGLCLLCAVLAKTIPDLVQGLISGTSMGGGSSIGSTAGQAVAGLAAVATAGIAAAAALSKVAESLGGGESGGGLAKSLGDSLQGGSGGPMGGGENNPSDGGSGGGAAAEAGAGSRIGGSSSASQSSAPRMSGADNTSSSSVSSPKSSAQIAAEQAKSGNPSAQKSESSTGETAHKLGDLAVKGLGLTTAMSMPGAENAASASLSPPTSNSGDGDGDGMRIESTEQENIIRPASDTSQPSAISALRVPGMSDQRKET